MSGAKHRGRVHVETSGKRVRAYLGGELVADTRQPRLVWEKPSYPTYYLPAEDVTADLTPTGDVEHSPSRGDGSVYDVSTTRETAKRAALRFHDSPLEELRGLVRFDWDAMDAWLEEDEPVYTHPRDPYTRVDILSSSRHVRVAVDGVTVAESTRPTILFETGLPPRYYLPPEDVREEALRPSEKTTMCPYKGTASYYSVEAGGDLVEDLVWSYEDPIPEAPRIKGLLCFFNEKVDLEVDGEAQERPRTQWS